jgi:hypothetical protein
MFQFFLILSVSDMYVFYLGNSTGEHGQNAGGLVSMQEAVDSTLKDYGASSSAQVIRMTVTVTINNIFNNFFNNFI